MYQPYGQLPLVSTFQSRDRAVIGRDKVGMGPIPKRPGRRRRLRQRITAGLCDDAMDVETVVCCSHHYYYARPSPVVYRRATGTYLSDGWDQTLRPSRRYLISVIRLQ